MSQFENGSIAVRTFNPHSGQPARAVQAWQILIGKAMNRQTMTYQDLSRLMYGKSAAGVIARILGHIAFYCIDNGLPPLTAIVVGKRRGTPGDEIPISAANIDEEREKVYRQNWYDLYPPSEKQLTESADRHSK
ncbi:MAG: hypothetical protein ACREE9_03185 [Stellaceae bacterium]